jgi:hypothetical protein
MFSLGSLTKIITFNILINQVNATYSCHCVPLRMKGNRITYRPKNTKTVLLGLICFTFTALGIFMTEDEPLKGWLIGSLFGLFSLVFIVQLIPGSTELELTEKGFTMTSLFRSHFTTWSDIKSFKTGNLGQNKVVMFDYIDGHKKDSSVKSFSKQISGSHAALPTNYGLKVSELLRIMNEWRKKHGTQQAVILHFGCEQL